jgi:1-acyl-sn-glycerol-3-phosphate acyltransferase
LLAKSLEAGQPITAAYIRYTLEADNGPGVTVEDDVCFWGDDVNMLKHIFKFVGLQGTHVWVRIASEPIRFSDRNLERRVAADEAREAVMELAPEGLAGMPTGAEEDDLMLHQN